MLHKIRERAQSEKGFTLIELLVVILIIGILAAIALPAFLGQQKKAQDADAKSNARNAVSQMESCYVDTETYTGCTDAVALAPSGLATGTGDGQVHVVPDGAPGQGYVVTAYSKSGKDFVITKTAATGQFSRTTVNPVGTW